MSSAKSLFKQTNVKRALLGAASAGMKVKGVVIDKAGNINVTIDNGEDSPTNALDAWRAGAPNARSS